MGRRKNRSCDAHCSFEGVWGYAPAGKFRPSGVCYCWLLKPLKASSWDVVACWNKLDIPPSLHCINPVCYAKTKLQYILSLVPVLAVWNASLSEVNLVRSLLIKLSSCCTTAWSICVHNMSCQQCSCGNLMDEQWMKQWTTEWMVNDGLKVSGVKPTT